MASYQGHLAFASVLGAAYGCAGVWGLHLDWGPVFLGAGLTVVGGLVPDLDSDSSVPVRELFNLLAVVVPLLIVCPLRAQFNVEETLVLLAASFLCIRFVVAPIFKRLTVHRGMFHSIPAMLIAGLVVLLAYQSPNLLYRYYAAGGATLGFLSHLVLDEMYAVNFMGVRIKLNKFAGSALKFWSASVMATMMTYAVLAVLALLAWLELHAPPPPQ